jgi:uncharacterized membrane protein YfcA
VLTADVLSEWLAYSILGAAAGFLAGLLGVGGGLIIVPVLTFIFTGLHFPATHVVHLALGTSLATILFTSISSLRAHHAHGAVNWRIWRGITPGIVTGTLAGSVLAAWLSSAFLKGFFVVFLFYVGTQMLLDIQPKASRELPGPLGLFLAGNVIGAVSSLVGIGGGTLSVPFMTWCNVKLHEAIGTSAAIGLPIAAAGAVGYGVNRALGNGAAGRQPRLRLSAGAGRHCLGECAHRAPGGETGPPPAGEKTQAHFCPAALRPGRAHGVDPGLRGRFRCSASSPGGGRVFS